MKPMSVEAQQDSFQASSDLERRRAVIARLICQCVELGRDAEEQDLEEGSQSPDAPIPPPATTVAPLQYEEADGAP